MTALHHAIAQNHSEMAHYLIDQGADVNAKSITSETPLHLATLNDNLAIVKRLVERGADVNAKNNIGETSIYIAATIGNVRILAVLDNAGGDVNLKRLDKSSPLSAAATEGHHVAVVYLVEEAGVDIKEQGGRALSHAANKGHLDIVDYLVSIGAPVNFKDKLGISPLLNSLITNHTEVAMKLIEVGADVMVQDKDKKNTIFYATVNNNLGLIKVLVDKGADISVVAKVEDLYTGQQTSLTPLMAAAEYGFVEIATFFISNGVDVNQLTAQRQNALHKAAQYGHTDIARMLHDHGCNMKQFDFEGHMPPHLAALNNHAEFIKFFVEETTYDVESFRNSKGGSILNDASYSGSLDVVKYLMTVPEGRDLIHAFDNVGLGPMHLVCLNGNIKVLEILMENGGDVNVKSDNGFTPLVFSVNNGFKSLAKALVENGADINLVTNGGSTAFIHACQSGMYDMVEYMLEKGADVTQTDSLGRTPLQLAIMEHVSTELCLLLLKNHADPSAVDRTEFGFTPLFEAIKVESLPHVRLLLSWGADTSHRELMENRTPKEYAEDLGLKDIASLL